MIRTLNQTTLSDWSTLWATAVLGVMAGFFWTYTFNVNLAMATVNGSTYAQMQSLFNVHVRHLAFFSFFFGGVGFTALALLCSWRFRGQARFWLLMGAGVVYGVGIVLFTKSVNLPLNALTESWDPAAVPADWHAVRDAWNDANAVRVVTSGLAFALGLLALMLRPTDDCEV